MNVQTITMSSYDARKHYKEYLARVRAARAERAAEARKQLTDLEREDEELVKSFRALYRGQKILNIRSVMRAAWLIADTMMPKLAIARANAQTVSVTHSDNGDVFVSDADDPYRSKRNVNVGSVFGAALGWPYRSTRKLPSAGNFQAVVPLVPPRLRPKKPEDYYVLWEAKWEKRPPDPDPLLLKRLGRDVFVIVAEWEMTALEQSILEGRIS